MTQEVLGLNSSAPVLARKRSLHEGDAVLVEEEMIERPSTGPASLAGFRGRPNERGEHFFAASPDSAAAAARSRRIASGRGRP